MKDVVTICKKPGRKDCFRITTEEDIPAFLKDVIRIEGKEIVMDCLEGEERAPVGSVIAFEKLSEETMREHGRKKEMNVWHKANAADTLDEVDGIFYEKPKPVKAILLTDELPEELVEQLGDAFRLVDGEYKLKTDWGISSAAPKNGYLIIYGLKDDGRLDANILTVGTPSFANYFVVTEEGKLGEPLEEHHKKVINPTKR